MSNLIGRRVGSIKEIEKPGDYFGPVMGYTHDKPAVFFISPITPPEDATNNRATRHVCSPPHTFRECADGSLEINPSILYADWHGYLDEGHVWRTI